MGCFEYNTNLRIRAKKACVIPAQAGIQRDSMKQYYVYILASKRNGTLYIGVTGNLIKRVYEHKNNTMQGFTERYRIHMLVYYEIHDDITQAITREKQIKKWKRQWKLRLIEKNNPQWNDLYYELI
jgi:putative endonuclease